MWSSIPTMSMRTTRAARRTSKKTISVLWLTFSFRWRRNHRPVNDAGLRFRSRPRLQVEVLDEYHLVALFVENELVDEPLGEENAKASGTHAECLAVFDVAQLIVFWVGDGGVGNFVQGKTFAGIANAALHHVTGAYVGNLNLLIGVEASAVLDGVDQHLARSHTHRGFFRVRQFGDLV